MHVQVIHSHPLAESYNHALFSLIVATLSERGHAVTATALYRDGFQPALTAAELTQLYARDPGRKVLMRALKPMCGSGVRSFYLAHYAMDRSTAASRQAFLARVRSVVSRL